MNIERDCEDCYKAEYMSHYIGEVFTGRITGVTNYGFYVELPNSVEGMVSVRDLPMGDYLLEDNIQLERNPQGNVLPHRPGVHCPGRISGCVGRPGQLCVGKQGLETFAPSLQILVSRRTKNG